MGFEIKNICTVVPNPYHPGYSSQDDCYYYFSLFITPRLQFDGKLKEFYEMVHWPEYAEKIFWNFKFDNDGKITDKLNSDINAELKPCVLFSPGQDPINLEKDYDLLKDLLVSMDIIREKNAPLDSSNIYAFLKQSKKAWKKLFHENVPVEAWPIYLKPQMSTVVSSEPQKGNSNSSARISNFPRSTTKGGIIEQHYDKSATIPNLGEDKNDKKNLRSEKYNATNFRQEFHKKISALARYPHVLRVLGLIQDFKVKKYQLNNINTQDFLLRIEFDISCRSTNSKDYPFDEFFRSVQFVRPYTRCEKPEGKLRSYIIHPPGTKIDISNYGKGKVPDYSHYVCNGFLNTVFLDENDPNPIKNVFSVDQAYYEDQTSDISQINNTKEPNVVGINTKIFSEEDIAVIKQKAAIKPKISKGFSIKVHGQPTDILVNMDEQFEKITDDTIEEPKSAFMAHHLDCGYRVDVYVTGGGGDDTWKSLCKRKASYVVDRKDDDIKIPLTQFAIRRNHIHLFKKLQDEPWLEEVRQIDEDGKANRFEEIARWNGWSLTCPPIYKKDSADKDNHESDDMELTDITPLAGSLPKLRFGAKYMFRIRTVDICGNGPKLSDNVDDQCVFKCMPKPDDSVDLVYERKEVINPPMFFAPYPIVDELQTVDEQEIENRIEHKKKEHGFKIKTKYKGEDNETLVIRTKVKPDGRPDSLDRECVRYLTPQHITMHFAETSGMLNALYGQVKKGGKDPGWLYEYLATKPKLFYEKDEIENRAIPFLTDPKVGYVLIETNDPKYAIPSEGINPVFRAQSQSEFAVNNKAIKLLLTSALEKSTQFELKYGKSLIQFNLPEGIAETLKIASSSITDSEISIRKGFRIIHAVQRPFLKCLEGEFTDKQLSIAKFLRFEKLTPASGTYEQNQKYQVHILPTSEFKEPMKIFPFSSTGKLTLYAEYCDYELNPNNSEGWSYISKDHPKETENDIKENKITSTNKTQDADKFYITQSWSNLNEETNDKYDTIINDLVYSDHFVLDSKPGQDPKSEQVKKQIKENFNFFIHSFPDTKFRKVKYKLEAVSKFSEFFDIEKHGIDKKDPNPFSVFASLDPSQNEQYDSLNTNKEKEDCFYTIIKNSAKPSKPNITSIVPVFTIEKTSNQNSNTYKFVHKTFRVYLGNTWYETGLDEKIAVILKAVNPTDEQFKNRISVIANDPTTDSLVAKKDSAISYSHYNGLSKDYIDSFKNELDSSDIEILPRTVDSLSDLKLDTPSFNSQNENPNAGDRIHDFGYSIFDVNWDMNKKEFYADITVNQNNLSHYSTLVKLAVCRYQEQSIIWEGKYDYRFSDVVMTDMVSILSERTVETDESKQGICIRGKLGYRYVIENVKQPDKKTLRENKFYLIAEGKDDEVMDIQNKNFPVRPIEIEHYYTLKDLNKLHPKALNNLKNCMVEEYEDIQLDNDFYMNDETTSQGLDDKTYNPRNDPRKRLVFFYKLE